MLPCCYQDCTRTASDLYRVMVDHDSPSWRDPITGRCEQLVYTFCGDGHRDLWAESHRGHRGTVPIRGAGRSGLVSPLGLPL